MLSWPQELSFSLPRAGGPCSQSPQPEEFYRMELASWAGCLLDLPADQPFTETLNLVM